MVNKYLYAALLVFIAAFAASAQSVERNEGFDASVNPWRDRDTGNTYATRDSAEFNAGMSRMQRNLRQQQMSMGQMMTQIVARQIVLSEIGNRKIRAGLATTRFVPQAAALAPDKFVEAVRNPQEKAELAAEYRRALDDFRAQEKAYKIPANDLAEAFALAFALNFEIFSGGQKPNDVQRASIAKSFRESLLKDAVFQGWTEADKQLLYEDKAIRTMLARAAYEAGARESNAAQTAAARDAAQALLARWWNKPVDGLELTENGFGDRGERIIREGKATTRVEFVAEPIVPREWAREVPFTPSYLTNLSREEQQRRHVAAWEKYYLDCLAEFKDELQKRGRETNDLSEMGALAVWLNYRVYSDGRELTARQYAGVAAFMRREQLKSAEWQGASARTKQISYESYAISAVDALSNYQQAEKKIAEFNSRGSSGGDFARAVGGALGAMAGDLKKLPKDKAKRNLDQLFAPRKFDDYALTENGFEPKATR